MENETIGQYRSHDPPKNFAIKVTFWKVIPGSVVPTNLAPLNPENFGRQELEMAERQVHEEKEEIVIHWQEKLFSQREFDVYSDSFNCVTALEQKYYDDVENIKRKTGDRLNKRVFTYIDGDSYTVLEEMSQITLNDSENSTPLIDKMTKLKHGNVLRKPYVNRNGMRRRRIVVDEPTEAMKNNHVITTPSKTMKIMLDLGVTDQFGSYIEDEKMICTVKIDAGGLLVIKPDINTGQTFTIETYHETRTVYQYTLEHSSQPMSKLETEQEKRLFTELYNRHSQIMLAQVGNEIYPELRKTDLLVSYLCEIVSAKDFEYDNLYVEYYLDLPEGWQSDTNVLVGVTQSCAMNKDQVAHFCFPFEFQLLYTWHEEHPEAFVKWPTLYLQVFSLDSWQRHRIEGYGYCQLSDVSGSTCVEIETWRPLGDSVFDEVNRYFIGGTPELKEKGTSQDVDVKNQDMTFMKDPQDSVSAGKLSKFYFKTKTTGTVKLRMNTIFQTKVCENTGEQRTIKGKKTVRRVGGFAAAVDSLSHVLGKKIPHKALTSKIRRISSRKKTHVCCKIDATRINVKNMLLLLT